LHIKLLEKEEQAKSKTRREIIKVSEKNNKLETKKKNHRINETKS
jgi:hypothetical protein